MDTIKLIPTNKYRVDQCLVPISILSTMLILDGEITTHENGVISTVHV